MDPELVVSCPVKVSTRCSRGHLGHIGNHSRLTINYIIDSHSPLLIVYDEHQRELLRMVPATDVTRYTILSPYRQEISRYNATTIILDFYEEDNGDVRTFTSVMEDVFRGLHRFSSQAEVRDSSSSGSDDDGERGGAAAALQPTPIVYWECAHCHFAHEDPHSWMCGECRKPREVNRDLEWQCDCRRIYPIGFTECNHCRIWRCNQCTYQNEPTSPHRCYVCDTNRIR